MQKIDPAECQKRLDRLTETLSGRAARHRVDMERAQRGIFTRHGCYARQGHRIVAGGVAPGYWMSPRRGVSLAKVEAIPRE